MPAMAALLMVVAWNMSEAHKSRRLVRKAPPGDVVVLLTCLLLTVFFDMVIAITVGVLLASLLFMKDLAALTYVVDITDNRAFVSKPLPGNWKVYKIRGALFFAAADRVVSELSDKIREGDGVILHMEYNSYLDAGGITAIEKLIAFCDEQQAQIYFSAWQFQPLKTLARATRDQRNPLQLSFSSLDQAIENALTGSKRDETE